MATIHETSPTMTTTTVPAQPMDEHDGSARAWSSIKRGIDAVVALALLVVLAPLLLAIGLAVRLDSPGPALFRQERHGRGLRPFRVWKFRTMATGASPELHRQYIAQLAAGADQGDGLKKLTADPRVTRLGAFLRRTSLDELPQLIHVVTGQMALVGPRPALAYELEHYAPRDFDRFRVRPGLTGLWQVSGRSELGFRQMLDLDAEYARTASPSLDARILLRTPLVLLSKRAA